MVYRFFNWNSRKVIIDFVNHFSTFFVEHKRNTEKKKIWPHLWWMDWIVRCWWRIKERKERKINIHQRCSKGERTIYLPTVYGPLQLPSQVDLLFYSFRKMTCDNFSHFPNGTKLNRNWILINFSLFQSHWTVFRLEQSK